MLRNYKLVYEKIICNIYFLVLHYNVYYDARKGKNMIKTALPEIKCNQCGHSFTPRNHTVNRCPGCYSPKFDQPKFERIERTCRHCKKSWHPYTRSPKKCAFCGRKNP